MFAFFLVLCTTYICFVKRFLAREICLSIISLLENLLKPVKDVRKRDFPREITRETL